MSTSFPRVVAALLLLGAFFPTIASAATVAEVRALVEARSPNALAAAEALAKEEPENGGAWIVLTRARIHAKRYEAAVAAGERATELAPDDAQAFLWFGNALGNRIHEVGMLSKMSMATKLRDAFERAIELEPSLIPARTSLIDFYLMAPSAIGGGVDKARAQAAAISKYDRAQGFVSQARIAMYEKKSAEALKAYEQAYALKPGDQQIRLALILGYQEAKRWSDALAAIKRWIAEEPKSNNAQYQLGRLAAVSGQYLAEGETSLRKYLAMPRDKDDPEPKNAHYRLGQVLAHAGRKDEARAAFQAALKLDPKMREAKDAMAAL